MTRLTEAMNWWNHKKREKVIPSDIPERHKAVLLKYNKIKLYICPNSEYDYYALNIITIKK
jgi:hypothetical protein